MLLDKKKKKKGRRRCLQGQMFDTMVKPLLGMSTSCISVWFESQDHADSSFLLMCILGGSR